MCDASTPVCANTVVSVCACTYIYAYMRQFTKRLILPVPDREKASERAHTSESGREQESEKELAHARGRGVELPRLTFLTSVCCPFIRSVRPITLSVCASVYAGVRGADQTYNQRRTRFLNAKKGAYK
jgi:hypothetical protein